MGQRDHPLNPGYIDGKYIGSSEALAEYLATHC